MDTPQTPSAVSPGLVEKLSILLAQAQRGEVTGFVGVVFMENGAANQWSVLTRREDRAQVPAALDELKLLHGEMNG